MRKALLPSALIASLFLALPALGQSQTTQPTGTIRVSGRPGQAAILRIDGRSYVDIEALARLVSGSLTSSGNEITLTLPSVAAATPSEPVRTSQPANSEFSKDFLKAGIEEMSVIREWRSSLLNAVQNGYPLTPDFVAGYQNQATTNLRLVFVAISTDSDRTAYQLLSNELNNMQKLSDKVMVAHKNMNYVPRDALKDDPLDQKILNCARSLASMAANGQFQNDGSCD